ncbi:LCP family protein [Isoptericola sp. b441]|uniref:LCP family protein n=1 Tax=Actinotalea lenta TaxID=3064654 RepID=A0ABT9DCB9_9CELL|nr:MULTISPECIES: LCP family protein [unclassified Isoptericola]MDO8108545.1 LCP family protein [Isoptericola sp. b441]MDO8119955.1 LCP family protein [Isoptericola sp. b490]
MTRRHASSRRARTPRHALSLRAHRVRHTAALVIVAVLAFTGAGVATALNRFEGNVTVADAISLAGPAPARTPSASPDATQTAAPDPTDPQAGKDVNILIMGSDERDGANAKIGGYVAGMRSDTTIVAHLSADRTRAELVSIPRDSLVDIPSCTMTNGKKSYPQKHAMFNSAFATGWDMGGDMASAAGCTIKTVQATTGLTIDHFVVVDFAGFQQMIDAVGGVPICIPKNYYSPDAGLNVKAGFQTLDGPTALAYARARKGTNMNGSDLQRTTRQQALIAAMVRELKSKNLLTNVGELLQFLDAATKSLTVDPGLSHLTDMAGLALSLKNLHTDHIVFMTIPVATAPSDPNRVVWTSASYKVWDRMANDEPVTETEVTPSTSPTPPTAGSSTPGDAGSPAPGSTGTSAPTQTSTPTVAPIPNLDTTSATDGGVCG